MTNALEALWPQSLRLRCGWHKRQNLQQQVPARAWPEVKALLGEMREAPTRENAEQRRTAVVEPYQREFPEAWRG